MAISALEKNKTANDKHEHEVGLQMKTRVVREGFPGKVTFKSTPQEDEGTSHVASWRRGIPGRGNSPGAGGYLVC